MSRGGARPGAGRKAVDGKPHTIIPIFGMMEINIEYNPRNDGYCCIFSHAGNEYYADVCELSCGLPSECMIFAYADGQVTNWTELYCKRGVDVSPEGLRVCIEEFVEQLEDDLKKLM